MPSPMALETIAVAGMMAVAASRAAMAKVVAAARQQEVVVCIMQLHVAMLTASPKECEGAYRWKWPRRLCASNWRALGRPFASAMC